MDVRLEEPVDFTRNTAEQWPQRQGRPRLTLGLDAGYVDDDGYNSELERDRKANDERLKSRFEGIFAKYGRDFSAVGDEIDLETGEIVVDNGHLRKMQHEADPGGNASFEFVEAFAEDWMHEGEDSSSENSDADTEESGDALDDGLDSDEDSTSGGTSSGQFGAVERNHEVSTSPTDSDETPIDPLLDQWTTAATILGSGSRTIANNDHTAADSFALRTQRLNREGSLAESDAQSSASGSFDLMDLPAVKESLAALRSGSNRDDSPDPEAIQALGLKIAHQLARFAKASKSKEAEKKRKNDAWDFPELPADKRPRTDAAPCSRPRLTNLTSLISPRRAREAKDKGPEPRASLWAPIQHPKPRKLKRKRKAAVEQDDDDTVETPAGQSLNKADAAGAIDLRKCQNCGTSATTTWRSGPQGSLCNACGMYLYRYGLMKPPRSPTPEPAALEGQNVDGYPANTSRRIASANAGSRFARFTAEEDALIIKLKEFDDLSWEQIGRHFVERSAFAVQCRYSKILLGNGKSEEQRARDALIEQGFDFEDVERRRNDGFTKKEDELLVQLRGDNDLDFAMIAEQFPNQTAQSLEERFNVLTCKSKPEAKKKSRSNGKLPKDSGVPYTPEEDRQLVKHREIEKMSWEAVAAQFKGRTALSIQKRYVRELAHRKDIVSKGGSDPYAVLFVDGPFSAIDIDEAVREKRKQMLISMDRAHFSRFEDVILIRLREDQKVAWDEIALQFPERSAKLLEARYDHLKARAVQSAVPVTKFEDPAIYDIPVSEDPPPDAVIPQLKGPWLAKSSKYSKAEDRLILKLRSTDGLDWVDIATYFPGRSAIALQRRYNTRLRHEGVYDPELDDVDVGSATDDLGHDSSASDADMEYDEQEAISRAEHHGMFDPDQDCLFAQPSGFLPPADLPGLDELSDGDLEPSSAFLTGRLYDVAPGRKYPKREEELIWKLHDRGLSWEDMAPYFPGRSAKSLSTYWAVHLAPGRRAQLDLHGDLAVSATRDRRSKRRIARAGRTQVSADAAPGLNLFHLLMQGSTTAIVADEVPVTSAIADWKKASKVGNTRDNDREESKLPTSVLPATKLFEGCGKDFAIESTEPEELHQSAENQALSAHYFRDSTPEVSGWEDSDDDFLPVEENLDETPDPLIEDSVPLQPLSPSISHDREQEMEQQVASHGLVDVKPATPLLPFPCTPSVSQYVEGAEYDDNNIIASCDGPTSPPPSSDIKPSYNTPARYDQQSLPYYAMPFTQRYSPIREDKSNDQETQVPSADDLSGEAGDPDGTTLVEREATTLRTRRSRAGADSNGEKFDKSVAAQHDVGDGPLPSRHELSSPPTQPLSGDAHPPPFSWNELITMALKSIPSQRLSTNGIHIYLQEKFPYFKTCAAGWKKTLLAHLKRSSDFAPPAQGPEDSWGFAEKLTPLAPVTKKRARSRKQKSDRETHSDMTESSDALQQAVGEIGTPIATEYASHQSDEYLETTYHDRPAAPTTLLDIDQTPSIHSSALPTYDYEPAGGAAAEVVKEEATPAPSLIVTLPIADWSTLAHLPLSYEADHKPTVKENVVTPSSRRSVDRDRAHRTDELQIPATEAVDGDPSLRDGAAARAALGPAFRRPSMPASARKATNGAPKRGPGRPTKNPRAASERTGRLPSGSALVGTAPKRKGRAPKCQGATEDATATALPQLPAGKNVAHARPESSSEKQPVSSDPYRDPESSSSVDADARARAKIEELKKFLAEQGGSESDSDSAAGSDGDAEARPVQESKTPSTTGAAPPQKVSRPSSPTLFTRLKKPAAPDTVYKRKPSVTPRNVSSTQRKNGQRATPSRLGRDSVQRQRSSRTPGSAMHVSLVDDSEDELA